MSTGHWRLGLVVAHRVRSIEEVEGLCEIARAVAHETAFVHEVAIPGRTAAVVVAPDGPVLVVDERVAEVFGAPGDDVERLMYGYSTLICLPNSLAESPSVATGTVMRPDTVRRHAADAGFTATSVLPIEHDVFRVYRLDP